MLINLNYKKDELKKNKLNLTLILIILLLIFLLIFALSQIYQKRVKTELNLKSNLDNKLLSLENIKLKQNGPDKKTVDNKNYSLDLILEELALAITNRIELNSILLTKGTIQISGRAKQSDEVIKYLEKLGLSPYLEDVQLLEMKGQDKLQFVILVIPLKIGDYHAE